MASARIALLFASRLPSSSRRPRQGPAAEKMHMQMIDRLPTVFACVDDHPIAFDEPPFTGQIRPDPQQMAKKRRMILSRFSKRNQMFARRNQNMNGRLRMNIGKGVAFVILVNGCRRDGSVDDFAEKAAHDGTSLQERVRHRPMEAILGPWEPSQQNPHPSRTWPRKTISEETGWQSSKRTSGWFMNSTSSFSIIYFDQENHEWGGKVLDEQIVNRHPDGVR
jgi:hypothetical protein